MFRAIAAAPILGALLLAGCGGGSSSSSSTSQTPPNTTAVVQQTKPQFIAEADAVCRRATLKLNAQQQKVNAALRADQAQDTPAHRSGLADALRVDVRLANPQLAQLRALKPPERDRTIVSEYLAAVARQIDLVSQFADAIANGNPSAVSSLGTEIGANKTTTRALAQGYGFKLCGATGT